jgi:hypothetical protein
VNFELFDFIDLAIKREKKRKTDKRVFKEKKAYSY